MTQQHGNIPRRNGPTRGRGNRSYNNKNKSSNNASQARKGLQDYIYSLGKQAAEYDTVTRYLLLHIRKTYQNGDDIGNALDTLQETTTFQPPKLKISTNDDETIKKRENREYEMIFEAKLALHLKQEDIYRTNKGKAYAFLFGRCSKTMQAKIMERKDYDSSKRDPIGLLQAIKELSLSYQDTKYDMKIITSAIKTFVNLKQKDDESLIDYTNRFKTARDVLKAQLGSELVLHKVVNADANYQEGDSEAIKDNNTKIIKKHYDRWIAYVYLENSDKNKYGSLINGLDSQQSLGTNQYPTTLGKATEVLSNHRFDAAYLEQKKKRNRHTSNNTESESKHKQDSND